MTTRIERDTLGEVEVPADAYYGAQTQRAVENFQITGSKPHPEFIWSVALIKLAAAEVNCSLNLLDKKFADAIMQAAREVVEHKLDEHFVVDPIQAGAGTSHHMNVNEVIANRATEILGGKRGEYLVHPNNHVNMAQSTNDVIPTAIRLSCMNCLPELRNTVTGLVSALELKSKEFAGIKKAGRTHLQDAALLTLGDEFGAYALAVKRDLARIEHTSEGLTRLGIGGTAVGSGLNAHPEYPQKMVEKLSTLTGVEYRLSENLYESMQSMADFAEFSSTLRILAGTLTRIANDLRLMASGPLTGMNEISLPAVQPGSSIMPGKVNPVMAEMLNMAMLQVIGLDTTVQLACQAGQLELNVMMPIIAHDLLEMMKIMTNSVKAFNEKCVRGIQANEDMIAYWCDRNPMIVTALNPLIGYDEAAKVLKIAVRETITIREALQREIIVGRLINLTTGKPLNTSEIEGLFGENG